MTIPRQQAEQLAFRLQDVVLMGLPEKQCCVLIVTYIQECILTAQAAQREVDARLAETICQHPHSDRNRCEFGDAPGLIATAIRAGA